MNLETSISVVIPCYNRETIVRRAIESALAQTVRPLEIVVIDDGSRDRTAEVAAACGPLVKVIRQQNCGAAGARNRGIQAAKGEWIAFLDSDDVWLPEMLEKKLQALSVFPEIDLIFCNTETVDEGGERLTSRFELGGLYGSEIERQGEFARYDRSLFLKMLTQSRIITSAVMVRRNIPYLEFPEHIWGSEDWGLWLNLALTARLASVDNILVTMFRQGDNLTANRTKGRLYRNDVYVLQDLVARDCLTEAERQEVLRALRERRGVAIYHSLIRGETAETQRLLKQSSPEDLGWLRYMRYWLATFLPGRVVRWLGRKRLNELYESY